MADDSRLDCGCGQPGCTDGAGLRNLADAADAVSRANELVREAESDEAANRIDKAIVALCKARRCIGLWPSGNPVVTAAMAALDGSYA